jgi:hypothetical protein
MEGLPLSGGLLGAVQLEPEGLVLLRPAVLTISLPQGTPPEEVVAFAYQENGEHVHLYPATIRDSTITFIISHFSGYGGGQGDSGEGSGWPPTGDPGTDYEQQVADLTNSARSQALTGGDGNIPEDVLVDLYRKWFNEVIFPALKAAEKNDALIDAAAASFLNWARQVVLLGLEQRLSTELHNGTQSLLKGLANAFDQSYQRCMQVDAYQAIKMLQRLRGIGLINGGYGATISGYTLEEKMPELQRCLTFKLQLDSLVIQSGPDSPIKYSTQVTGEVTLKLNPNTFRFDGVGTVKAQQFTMEGWGESLSIEGFTVHCDDYQYKDWQNSTTLSVKDALIAWGEEDKNGPDVRAALFLKPGELMSGTVTITCWTSTWPDPTKNYSPPTELPSSPFWSGSYPILHEDQFIDDEYGYVFDEFETGSGQLFARLSKAYEFEQEGYMLTEDLTLDLLHTPGE